MGLVRSALTGIAIVGASATAGAAPTRIQALSEYHAAPVCPGEFTFRAQVQARTARLELVPALEGEALEAPRRFVVRLRQTDEGYAGTLEIKYDGTVSMSSLEAPTCDEVVAGLSIAAALSVEPEAVSPPIQRAPVPPTIAVPVSPPEVAPIVSSRDQRANWLVGAHLGARLGYAPRTSLGVGVVLGRYLTSRGRVPWRASALGTFGSELTDSSATPIRIDFTHWEVRGDVCPISLAIDGDAQLLGCPSLELGITRVKASTGETSLRPWLAPGLVVRLMVRFDRFFLAPELDGRAPLVRDHYWFRPDKTAFHAPALVGEVACALGIAF